MGSQIQRVDQGTSSSVKKVHGKPFMSRTDKMLRLIQADVTEMDKNKDYTN